MAQPIGDFVRTERKRQNLTQQQLAVKSGVGLNFVYQLEKNKASVQLDVTNQVLNALGYELGVARRFKPWEEDEGAIPSELVPESAPRSGASSRW